MLTFKKIAVTGGIASGKSTVCRLLKELGAYVLSADDIVHQLLSPHTDLGKKIIALLGQDVVVKDSFSREAIAKKVFNSHPLLKELEELLHPEVQRLIEGHYNQLVQTPHEYTLFVVEVPLFFESRQEPFYDAVVLVVADEKSCSERFMKKTGYKEDEFTRRNARLIPLKEKAERADFVVENNGTIHELTRSVNQLYNHLTR